MGLPCSEIRTRGGAWSIIAGTFAEVYFRCAPCMASHHATTNRVDKQGVSRSHRPLIGPLHRLSDTTPIDRTSMDISGYASARCRIIPVIHHDWTEAGRVTDDES